MGRGTAKTPGDGFGQIFGTRRGKIGEQDAFTGRKTLAADNYIAQLGTTAKSGDVGEPLALLRERGMNDPEVAPLVEGITTYATVRALDNDWLGAIQRFFHLSNLQEPGHSVWKIVTEGQYEKALAQHLAPELERGIGHLRSKDDINGWLIPCAVQGTLIELTSDILMGPAGEEILQRSLGKERYQEYLSWANENGLEGVYALVNREELAKALSPLLPSEAGEYALSDDVLEEFEINSYDMAIASGLVGLQSK